MPKPTLAIDHDGLARLRKQVDGIHTDELLAQRLGLTRPSVNRVINGVYAPGPRFIAAALKAFGKHWFSELFKVVDDK